MPGYLPVFISGQHQFAGTPASLLHMIQAMFWEGQSAFDPCPVNPEFDGLSIPWKTRNYINPPFSNIAAWAQKASKEPGNSVLLMPIRPTAAYLHDIILPACNSLLIFCNRVCFMPYKTPLPVSVMLINFHGHRPVVCEGLRLKRVAFDHWALPITNTYDKHFLTLSPPGQARGPFKWSARLIRMI